MFTSFAQPLSRLYCRFLIHHRLFFTLLIIGLTLLAALLSRHAHLSSRLTDYYPSRHPHVRLYQEFTEMLKMTNTVIVTVTAKKGTIYTPEILGKIHRITVALIETKGVNPFEVMSLTHPRLKDIKIRNEGINILPVVDRPEEPQTPEELLRIKNAVYTNLGIRGIYVSPDDRTALIRAGFWDRMADPVAIFERLRALATQESDATTEVAFSGNLVLAAWLIDAAPRFLLLLLISAGLALGMIALIFGVLHGALAVILVNLITALWGFAALGLLEFSLEPLALLVLFPLCARGVTLVLSWYTHFRNEYRTVFIPFEERQSRELALERTALALWRPLTSALLVDGIAFTALVFSDVPALRALGGFGIGWLLGLVFALWTFLPVWSTWLSLRTAPLETFSRTERFVTRIATRFRGRRSPPFSTYLALAAFSVLGFLAAVQLEAGREMMGTTLFYPAHPYNRAFALVNEKFIGINQLIVIAQARGDSAFRNPEALQALEAFQHHMAADDQLGGAVAITNIIKSVTRMFHEGIPKWEMLPDDMDASGQVIFRIIATAATPSEVERFLSTDLRTTAVTLFYRHYSPTVVAQALARAQAFTSQNGPGVEFRPGGGILGILAAIHSAVEKTYWSTFALLVLLTAAGGLLGLGTPRAALGAVLSLVLSQAAMLLLLWAGGIDLNMFTLPVLVLSFGTPLLPTFLMWMPQPEAAAQIHARALTATGLILASAAAAWLFSPLRLQAEMGFFLILFALAHVLLPLRLQRIWKRASRIEGQESGVRVSSLGSSSH